MLRSPSVPARTAATAVAARPVAPAPRAGLAPAAPAAVPSPRHWALGVAVIVVGMFMSLLDSNIVIVPLPAIEKEFNAIGDDAQWVTVGYRLALAVVVPAAGWLGDRLGLRRLYVVALALFGISSLLCGVAGDLPSLIAFRVLQAVPGAIVPVTCMTLLYRITPPAKLGLAMCMYGAGVILAPALSPLLGGWFTEYLSWRMVFLMNVPIAALGVLGTMLLLPVIPVHPARRRFDLPGFTAIALSLFAFSLAIGRGQEWGWTSYKVLALLAIGTNALALFVGIELWVTEPLLNLRVFRCRPFVGALVLLQVIYTAMQALVYFVPLFLEQGQSLTPTHTGLTLLPQGLAWMLFLVSAGPLFNRYGARWPTIIGMVLMGAGSLLLTRVGADLPRPMLMWFTCLMAAGLGLSLVPALGAGIAALPPEQVNDGMTFRNMVQRVTGAFSLTALTTMCTVQQAQLFADRSALLRHDGADVNPAISRMEQHGPGGLAPLWRQLNGLVALQTYSNAFLTVGVIVLAGAALAYLLRWGRPPRYRPTALELDIPAAT